MFPRVIAFVATRGPQTLASRGSFPPLLRCHGPGHGGDEPYSLKGRGPQADATGAAEHGRWGNSPGPLYDDGNSCGCLGGAVVWPGGVHATSAALSGGVHGARARWISATGNAFPICSSALGWAMQVAGRLQLRRWVVGTDLVGSD